MIPIEKEYFEIIKFCVQKRLSISKLRDYRNIDVRMELFADDIVCILEEKMLQKQWIDKEERLIFPITIWDWAKYLWLPDWLKRLFPSLVPQFYEYWLRTTINKLCPHISIPENKNKLIHFEWLKMEKGE